MVWPGLAVLLTTLAFNLLGDGLRDAFDPRSTLCTQAPAHTRRLTNLAAHNASHAAWSGKERLRPEPAPAPARQRKESRCRRRLWLSIVPCGDRGGPARRGGVCRLGEPAAAERRAKKGGTLRVNMSTTDFDFIDPALAYGSSRGRSMYATAAQAPNYPDKAGAAAARSSPRLRPGSRVSKDGKTYTFTVKPGLQVQRRHGGHGGELRVRDQAGAQPEDAVAGCRVPATDIVGLRSSSTARRK